MMKNLTHFLSLMVLMLLSVPTWAQFDGSELNSRLADPEATKLLDNVKKQFEQAEQFAATFKMKIHYPGQEDILESGELIQQGAQFYLDMNSYLIVSNEEKKWVYLKADNNVNIYSAKSEDSWMTPMDFLQMYEEETFEYAIVPAEMAANKDFTYIEFKSTDRNSEYSKMRMALDHENHQIKSVKAFAKDGSRYELTISEYDFDPSISPQIFTFNQEKYPGITVEDLRID